jgi:TPP-dependent pyruvate/acetoin dehydrogenase alpha subunit
MLKEKGFLTTEQESSIVQKMHAQVDSAFDFAHKSEYPNANDALHDVFVNGHLNGRALV